VRAAGDDLLGAGGGLLGGVGDRKREAAEATDAAFSRTSTLAASELSACERS
jgi:hypothetical protein